MRRLRMTRDAFSERIGMGRRALDTWLLPDDSPEMRAMPEIARRYISEILASQPVEADATLSAYSDDAAMASFMQGNQRHLLSVDQFDRGSVEDLFHLADVMQPIAQRRKVTRVLEGAVLANLFFEPSTRTRLSFASAFCRLGGSVCDTTGFTFSSMAKGESIADTSRVISGYADAIVVRHPDQGSVAEFARPTQVPVVNGGDGIGEHPTQALLDLYTVQNEFSRLGKTVDGARIALLGDLKHGRTVHSLIKLLALYKGLEFTLVSPPSLEMPAAIVERVEAAGHTVRAYTSLGKHLQTADMVYATRIQKERLAEGAVEGYDASFELNRASVDAHCQRNVVLMHPLPRDGRPGSHDLSVDLDDDPRLAIFRQTDNGIPIRMAIFASLLGVGSLVQRSMKDAAWHSPRPLRPGDAFTGDPA
jgi:aspartate carbamoyltransferase catalytic subunit